MTTTTQPIIQQTVDVAALLRLARVRGGCLSFFLPDQKPGAPTGTHHSILRQLVREVPPDLLGAMSGMLEDERLKAGGLGLAIFCSAATGVEAFRVRGIQDPSVFIGDHYHLTPLLRPVFETGDIFILGLSRQHMRLCRYENHAVSEVAWPVGVPVSLAEAEHGRTGAAGNHSLTGVSPSAMSSVQFGSVTRPDREGADHHLTQFFQLVDAGLEPLLAGAPLLLGGVVEEIACYRKVAKYRAVMEQEITGSVEHKRTSELAELAHSIATEAYFAESDRVLAGCQAMKNKLDDSGEIVKAALEGRMHRLCVREGAAPQETSAAVAETLCTGGEVFDVRALPGAAPMVAALRY